METRLARVSWNPTGEYVTETASTPQRLSPETQAAMERALDQLFGPVDRPQVPYFSKPSWWRRILRRFGR